MIDIIIPAYNAFNTLGNTLTSIAKQINYKDLKIYIVNDGSEKSYDYIIKNYLSFLDITEIFISNSGPGVARQVGLDYSKNEFIVFIDSDDILYNEFSIINLLNIINGNDLAQGCFMDTQANESKVMSPQYCYLHGKMYRRSIINKYNIRFDELKRLNGDIYEDSTFNQLYSLYCDNIATTNEIIYAYQNNPLSITKANDNKASNLYNFIDAMSWLFNQIEKRKITKKYEIAWNICIILFHIYFNYLITNDENDFVFENCKKLKKAYNKYIKYLPYEEQLAIFKYFDYPTIPTISFYDFLKKIK